MLNVEETCELNHDWFTAVLSTGLIVGLVISYVPQHLRIIKQGSSEGFSPWFLLLGSTASAAAALNIVTLQWGIIKCCRVVSALSCLEATAGVSQVVLLWFLFTFILVLYMIYYPPHLKYTNSASGAANEEEAHSYGPNAIIKPESLIKTPEWRLAIIVSWVTFAHLIICTFVTFYLLQTSSPHSPSDTESLVQWATFLGSSSAISSAVQYLPQITRTYRAKTVGALSIPMMVIQTPGAVFMVLSIALRPGTNWTSWITYAVAGIMQGSLLTMCIVWKFRQARLNIDDFGRPLGPNLAEEIPNSGTDDVEPTVETLLETALEDAVEEDVRAGATVIVADASTGERTPLIGKRVEGRKNGNGQGWVAWVRRRT